MAQGDDPAGPTMMGLVAIFTSVVIATAAGVFGVPTFFCNQEMFWGNDSIEYLKMHIAGKDPLDQKKYQDFLIKHPFNQ